MIPWGMKLVLLRICEKIGWQLRALTALQILSDTEVFLGICVGFEFGLHPPKPGAVCREHV